MSCYSIYTGDKDIREASESDGGIAAVIVSAETAAADNVLPEGVDAIFQVNNPYDVEKCQDGAAFFVDTSTCDQLKETLTAVPSGSVVIAAISSMQDDNLELAQARELKSLGVSAILMKQAVMGDGEDLEYTGFVVSGLTKKKSSTFNMSGLTGSTNGHFGGVSSSQAQTWLRQKRREEHA